MLRSLVKGLIDTVYPKICLICKKRLAADSIGGFSCPQCWQKAKRNIPPFCGSCGRHMEKPSKNICGNCIKKPLHFDRAFSPFVYEGTIKELIHHFKYKNKDYLGAALTKPMLEFIKEFNLPLEYMDSIVPVPLHKSRLREREFNQAEALSLPIAAEFNKPVLSGCLNRPRPSRTQTDLASRERFLNVRGAFCVEGPDKIKGKNILLVDDVLTSGATCSEAARTLKEAGAGIVFALTLAN